VSFLRRIPEPETVRDTLEVSARGLTLNLIGEYRTATRELVRVWFDGRSHDPAFFRAWLEMLSPDIAGSFDRNMDPARVDEVAQPETGARL